MQYSKQRAASATSPYFRWKFLTRPLRMSSFEWETQWLTSDSQDLEVIYGLMEKLFVDDKSENSLNLTIAYAEHVWQYSQDVKHNLWIIALPRIILTATLSIASFKRLYLC